VPITRNIASLSDARDLLLELGAPSRLVRHAELVSEAAEALLVLFTAHGIALDVPWVRAGAALHDVGKLDHQGELDRPGALHEPAGELLLLAHGVAPPIARCCRSHADRGRRRSGTA